MKGIKISQLQYITHLLFVYDVLFFGKGFEEEWAIWYIIFKVFSLVSHMDISLLKSSFLYNEVEEEVLSKLLYIFPLQVDKTDRDKLLTWDISLRLIAIILKTNCYCLGILETRINFVASNCYLLG